MANDTMAGHRGVPILTTDRLVLRGHRASDFEDLCALWGDPEAVRFISAKPSAPSECWARLLRYAGHWALQGFGFWAVEERGNGRYVGDVGLADFKRGLGPAFDGAPEAGWVLAPWSHGKGYASEAAAAALAWADEHLKTARYVCMIDLQHSASRRVAEKCGFTTFAEARYLESPVILLERVSA